MSKLNWYWHRLRAMSPVEMALRARKKWRQFADARRLPDWRQFPLEASGAFPPLPPPGKAPAKLRDALRRDMEDILAGRWKAFGHLDLNVDDPPEWHRDYLAGRSFDTTEIAFKLDHRALAGGADIKLIWELSRWHALTRLAMAAHVLADERAAGKCVSWLEDWVKRNPPYHGWNWTSALEVGMRLIQFAWIDALLSGPSGGSALQERLAALRQAILPAHVRFAWRHKSFGSSANNHLLGELAGCLIATARWPALARWGASLDVLQPLWEHEVLAQFAEDGGNREQASSYHLFSWEFCWQARAALLGSGRKIRDAVETRLNHAVAFETEVRCENELWDYGDSDNAFVTPLCLSAASMTAEWHQWMKNRVGSPALEYWLGESPEWQLARESFGGTRFARTGIVLRRDVLWTLRWDLSRLGYLRTAAHGHLDALHLSLWYRGVALIIDPGTGAYYADTGLRNWLASRAAHNAPCPLGSEQPARLGPFLWAKNHPPPSFAIEGKKMTGALSLTSQRLRRSVEPLDDGSGWLVQDECAGKDGRPVDFTVRWQFPPESCVKRLDSRRFLLKRHGIEIKIEVSEGWADVLLVEIDTASRNTASGPAASGDFEGIVSPAFRQTARAPFLKLIARPRATGVFTTRFSA